MYDMGYWCRFWGNVSELKAMGVGIHWLIVVRRSRNGFRSERRRIEGGGSEMEATDRTGQAGQQKEGVSPGMEGAKTC